MNTNINWIFNFLVEIWKNKYYQRDTNILEKITKAFYEVTKNIISLENCFDTLQEELQKSKMKLNHVISDNIWQEQL